MKWMVSDQLPRPAIIAHPCSLALFSYDTLDISRLQWWFSENTRELCPLILPYRQLEALGLRSVFQKMFTK